MELIVLKRIHDNDQTGVVCKEVIGIYTTSITITDYDVTKCKIQAKPWLNRYLKHLDPDTELGYRAIACDDLNCVFAYELFEVYEDEDDPSKQEFVPFETLYFLKQKH